MKELWTVAITTTVLAGAFCSAATADVILKATSVKRGCWVNYMEGLWIHCSNFNDYQGSNYDYLEWTFGGSAGTYELQINHIAHFSGRPKHYVTHNGKTVYGPAEAPISATGWCCADRGSPCRETAKDNYKLVSTGVKLALKAGDKIRFYGNVHYGCPGHGNYSGIKEIILKGSGSVTAPVCGNGKCESGETSQNCSKDCGSIVPVEQPIINASPPSITMQYRIGDAAFPKVAVTITNSGKGTLPQLSAKAADTWIGATVSGSGNSQTVSVTLTEQARNAVPKSYTSSVTISGSNVAAKTIPLALTVTSLPTQTSDFMPGKVNQSQNEAYNVFDISGAHIGSYKRSAVLQATRNLKGMYLITDSQGRAITTLCNVHP